ncbi:MAG TPA: methylenetetrahydrofolate reductase [NAD(P)H] [Phycisphaerae bacterium]|nr:methylenetetrahydrofolate reductase [NAD(P)H] [Phycisphaerae bacterium]HOB74968.1 methylenetetrahydrofolate reductase [NAD(P)H] [Phycisphaerae bacterium]HOJ55758.1 methylenetetrahydrofolate reductase [NAD(P)H] [Phycisphaerae bacterium]HOL25755.1 methylenetetrahydrofolate reductase [NAD(P)H] [Phycisphaerae bacterium]HPP19552.1 methylenetetrahydrofolate reductase [NAD(P)H] [Phycisphaerae bacterium]
MLLSELHRSSKLVISFELFPPKTPEGEVRLFERAIPEMLKLRPAFLTCTYGAGGTTHEKTMEILSRIRREFPIDAASHLTCLGGSREAIREYLMEARANGINNIVALRGDPPKGVADFRPPADGFRLARDLVAFIKEIGGFDVAVAGYPEGHPECPDKYLDWQRLAAKVEAGADAIITQLFYDNRDFFEFRDYLRGKLGVKVPIVAGVLPILSTHQIKRFCGLCGAKLPPGVLDRLDAYADDDEAARQYGVELATRMCEELIRGGVDGIHFYTLNRSESTGMVLRNLALA